MGRGASGAATPGSKMIDYFEYIYIYIYIYLVAFRNSAKAPKNFERKKSLYIYI